MDKKPTYALGFAVACMVLSGCYLRPDWGPPGTIGQQRSRAVMHDPFPSDDLGPPILGGRPKGFERPPAEPIQVQTTPYAQRRRPTVPQFAPLPGGF